MHELDAGALRELLHGHVHGHAHPRTRIRQLALIGLGIFDEIINVAVRRLVTHDQRIGVIHHADDPGKVIDDIKLGFLNVWNTQDRLRHLCQQITVGLAGVVHHRRRQRTARTGTILDDDFFTQGFAGGIGQRAQQHRAAAARRISMQQGDVLLREILRCCRRHAQQAATYTEHQRQPPHIHQFKSHHCSR